MIYFDFLLQSSLSVTERSATVNSSVTLTCLLERPPVPKVNLVNDGVSKILLPTAWSPSDMRHSHWVISLKIGSFEESFFKVSPFPFSSCSQIKMSSRSLKCKDDWRAVAKISLPETQLANFRQIKKKKELCFLTSLRAPVLATASLRKRRRVINFHLRANTSAHIYIKKRKKLSSATCFCLAFFFFHWQAGDDMSMHVTEGPFWETGASKWHQNVLLNICYFVSDGEMSRKWPLFYFFFWRKNLLIPSRPPMFFLCSHLLHPSLILVFHIQVLTSGLCQQLTLMRRAAAIRVPVDGATWKAFRGPITAQV